MVNNILGLGLQGVQQGIAGMDTAARKIANAGVQTDSGSPSGAENGFGSNLVESMVDLRLYERNVQASSQVVKTANELVGTLLDEMA